ncbi:hypothetical protein GMORB2_4736 [Geosmithia morbida]|uniref:Uncharacterized protein n=1 Tax=Geosmithia morbida TaxID=1094350 RepID=A0A9P4YPY1_9HYPO|nr:uncharacterized protein GMORB2_4736 [Geosmithia morbida]KAF4119471.1 hypothetical protein GMORB2_4736 [Geosmithia morbida]
MPQLRGSAALTASTCASNSCNSSTYFWESKGGFLCGKNNVAVELINCCNDGLLRHRWLNDMNSVLSLSVCSGRLPRSCSRSTP